MKNINKYILSVLAILMIASIVGIAEENKPTAHSTYVKYVDSTSQMKIDISNLNPGNIVYLENYYSIDSFGNPKFYASRRYESVTNLNKLTFTIYRPKDGKGDRYSFVERIIVNNKQRTELGLTDLRKFWN